MLPDGQREALPLPTRVPEPADAPGTLTGRTQAAQTPANPRLWTQWTHQHYKNDEQEADQEKKVVPDASSASGTLIFLAF
jgi:hypothetical protein